MSELRLYSRVVNTVFDLLGVKEDDITYSVGWALAQSGELTAALLNEFFDGDVGALTAVRLQESIPGAGRTDIEVETEHVHLILEAKRGWDPPDRTQLAQYVPRFKATKALTPTIAAVAEGPAEWAAHSGLPDAVKGIPVRYASWRRIAQLVDQTAGKSHSNSEKRLLRELHRYLKGVMTVQNVQSNLVYVVPLRNWPPLVKDGTTFADIVVKKNRYFHPIGGGPGGWPSTPPNYLGFRFDGRLQQIRHVDSYEVHDEPWETIIQGVGAQQDPPWHPEPHYFYNLGKPIVPQQEVLTGGLFGPGRHWAAIDLLLTCKTVREARDKTRKRLEAAGEW